MVVAWVFHGEREGEVSWFDPLQVEIGIECQLRSIVAKIEEGVNFELKFNVSHQE